MARKNAGTIEEQLFVLQQAVFGDNIYNTIEPSIITQLNTLSQNITLLTQLDNNNVALLSNLTNIDEHESQLTALNELTHTLETRLNTVESLTYHNTEIIDDLTSNDSDNSSIDTRLNHCTNNIIENTTKINSLRHNIDELENSIIYLTNQINTIKTNTPSSSTIDTIQNNINTIQNNIDSQSTSINQINSQINLVQEQSTPIDTYTTSITQINSNINILQEQINAINHDLTLTKQSIPSFTVNNFQSSLQNLDKKIIALENSVINIFNQLQSYNNIKDAFLLLITNLEANEYISTENMNNIKNIIN